VRAPAPDDQDPQATGDDNEAPEAQGDSSDSPILDLSDAAVKRMIKLAKQRGYVTYDELNEVLPSEENSSEHIEDIMTMLTDMGINVVETEEQTEEAAPAEAPPPAKPAAKKTAGGSLPTTTAEKIAWCRTHDAKG
jgi:RNA polymerase primary sigma factor